MSRRALVIVTAALPTVLLLVPASAAPAAPSSATVVLKDSPLSFVNRDVVVTLAAGTARVRWQWDTTSVRPHSVKADDGSFDSHTGCNAGGGYYGADTSLAACGYGATTIFTQTFHKPGLYRYFCAVHGARNGQGMSGTVLVKAAAAKKRR